MLARALGATLTAGMVVTFAVGAVSVVWAAAVAVVWVAEGCGVARAAVFESLAPAETGVSVSAMNVWRRGTSVLERASSRTSSSGARRITSAW